MRGGQAAGQSSTGVVGSAPSLALGLSLQVLSANLRLTTFILHLIAINYAAQSVGDDLPFTALIFAAGNQY